jgi:hypothetical protein
VTGVDSLVAGRLELHLVPILLVVTPELVGNIS